MGEVYRARRAQPFSVALKVLPQRLASDPNRLEGFKREAKTVAALNHPNIVTIHSVEETDGIHFLTMELVEGETLDQHVPADGLGLSKLFDLAIPIADALAEAHAKGIIHCDFKPANVMVNQRGQAKVLDLWLGQTGGDRSKKRARRRGDHGADPGRDCLLALHFARGSLPFRD